jgi:hypothetical protein
VEPEAAARARLRASDADRERVVEALKFAFVQGRLTRDELDTRAGLAFVARTYAELAVATADIPARRAAPRPRPRPTPDWPPPDLPASRTARRPANHWGFKWALALATIALPTMIAATLATRSKDLFSSTTLALMAYVLALLIAVANGIAARIDDDETGRSSRQRRRCRRNVPKGHGGRCQPHEPGGSPGGCGERGSRRRGVGVPPGVGAACRVADARTGDGGW